MVSVKIVHRHDTTSLPNRSLSIHRCSSVGLASDRRMNKTEISADSVRGALMQPHRILAAKDKSARALAMKFGRAANPRWAFADVVSNRLRSDGSTVLVPGRLTPSVATLSETTFWAPISTWRWTNSSGGCLLPIRSHQTCIEDESHTLFVLKRHQFLLCDPCEQSSVGAHLLRHRRCTNHFEMNWTELISPINSSLCLWSIFHHNSPLAHAHIPIPIDFLLTQSQNSMWIVFKPLVRIVWISSWFHPSSPFLCTQDLCNRRRLISSLTEFERTRTTTSSNDSFRSWRPNSFRDQLIAINGWALWKKLPFTSVKQCRPNKLDRFITIALTIEILPSIQTVFGKHSNYQRCATAYHLPDLGFVFVSDSNSNFRQRETILLASRDLSELGQCSIHRPIHRNRAVHHDPNTLNHLPSVLPQKAPCLFLLDKVLHEFGLLCAPVKHCLSPDLCSSSAPSIGIATSSGESGRHVTVLAASFFKAVGPPCLDHLPQHVVTCVSLVCGSHSLPVLEHSPKRHQWELHTVKDHTQFPEVLLPAPDLVTNVQLEDTSLSLIAWTARSARPCTLLSARPNAFVRSRSTRQKSKNTYLFMEETSMHNWDLVTEPNA